MSSSDFKSFAKENLILLFVDSPRKKPIPPDQSAYNRKLAEQLNFGNSVPSVLLLDSSGKVLEKIGDRRTSADHIYAIKKALGRHK